MDFTAHRNNDNKMNVINLSTYSVNSGSTKIKSHYCKKITLTNVDKYYQFCLKKVKAIDPNVANRYI